MAEKPPKPTGDYTQNPWDDSRENFVQKMARLVWQDAFDLVSPEISFDLFDEAMDLCPGRHYAISMQQVPVNFGQMDMAHGRFFLDRIPQKKADHASLAARA